MKEASKTLVLFQMEEDISPASLQSNQVKRTPQETINKFIIQN